ncbi:MULTISPECIES: tyrosine-type recombinase/integrase [Lysinibacillus]|jgi:integrase|uniref:tyrosine-type recombinase/integrase n=1 Tax=Lysinibacillus TaxID=400634 RepID=UPI0004D799CA|nr:MULTISPECIES: tyrosine-type recombinase/integrase [Lysinibacillus]AJK87917.1 recombinase XerC [Lysinibacillus fusiformis]KHK50857.1 recombinase XerC [Lysinibacillus sp. A1]MCE4042579.1 tyrosine-type recombinase/integrase [Lysinibacillus fusiformis]
MKLYKSLKEPEIYHYFNANKEKLWMFRHKYYDASGKRREKKKSGFTTEKTALKALMEVKTATLRGETKQIENDRLTVGEWLDTWYEINHRKWKISTSTQREMIIRMDIKPLLGHYKLQQLDKLTYEREYIAKLEGRYSSNTVRLRHSIFKIAINAAVENELIARNRFTKVKITEPDKYNTENINFLSPEQLVTFLEDAKKHENITNYSLLLTVAYTGIRRGEALGLQWQNINFTNNTITIERTRDDKGVRSPKTNNSYRTILVDNIVMKQLEVYQKWCKGLLFSCGKKLTESTFVFLSANSFEPLSAERTKKIVDRITKRTLIPKITLHGLRHTHCTILLLQGMNVKVISERLGNTPDMIYKVYGHVLKEMETESVALFSNSLQQAGARTGAIQ